MKSKKPLFNKVAIVGVGLIGGSLGLALKKKGIARKVVGVVRSAATAHQVKRKRAVDIIEESSVKNGVRDADLVILALPVSTIIRYIEQIDAYMKPGAVVIDVGSTKKAIVRAAEKHIKKHVFVGCHPMAGSEKSGVQHARPDLFMSANCFMTSSHAKISRLWRALGSRPVQVSPDVHDRWVAKVSHLPHMLSFALMKMLDASDTSNTLLHSIGQLNPSVKPIARLSKSDPDLWCDIFLSNRKELLECLEAFEGNLRAMREAIAQDDKTRIRQLIMQARLPASALMPDDD